MVKAPVCGRTAVRVAPEVPPGGALRAFPRKLLGHASAARHDHPAPPALKPGHVWRVGTQLSSTLYFVGTPILIATYCTSGFARSISKEQFNFWPEVRQLGFLDWDPGGSGGSSVVGNKILMPPVLDRSLWYATTLYIVESLSNTLEKFAVTSMDRSSPSYTGLLVSLISTIEGFAVDWGVRTSDGLPAAVDFGKENEET